jgi:CHU_C Type IX secretion signal domain
VPSRDVNRTDWTPEPIGDCLTCPQQTFRPEETTLYVATVYDDQGCPATDSLLVAVLPKVFSPNVLLHGSTLANDRFTLFTKEPLPMPYLRIFDRWGDLVFEKTQLTTNDTAAGWDGNRPNGREALPGVYVFKAAVEYVPGQVVYLEGDVTVVR